MQPAAEPPWKRRSPRETKLPYDAFAPNVEIENLL